ncbi:uncharacterized protein LOC124443738 [Xenia sp. Carnegie-2017]|uniref:uncharacterized protein LOC124443738 n=1 Tax=Xenia sp. Carnegie-2017 TaxID=2897299 RepID=UPI001F03EF6D|nr:uncharacterized protein LOC124443738 [Xenia sp. Carnegie-2017]
MELEDTSSSDSIFPYSPSESSDVSCSFQSVFSKENSSGEERSLVRIKTPKEHPLRRTLHDLIRTFENSTTIGSSKMLNDKLSLDQLAIQETSSSEIITPSCLPNDKSSSSKKVSLKKTNGTDKNCYQTDSDVTAVVNSSESSASNSSNCSIAIPNMDGNNLRGSNVAMVSGLAESKRNSPAEMSKDIFFFESRDVHHIDRNTEQEDKATHESLPDHVPVVKVNNPGQDCEEDDMFFLRMSPSQPSEAFVNETPFRRNTLVTKDSSQRCRSSCTPDDSGHMFINSKSRDVKALPLSSEDSDVDDKVCLRQGTPSFLTETEALPSKPFEKCVFTKIKESGIGSNKCNRTDHESEDEFSVPPSTGRNKRKHLSKNTSSAKKVKNDDRVHRVLVCIEDQRWENYGQINKRGFLKTVKTRKTTTVTTLIEVEVEIIYSSINGTTITKETKHEFGEPTYKVTTMTDETQEEVSEIPPVIEFDETLLSKKPHFSENIEDPTKYVANDDKSKVESLENTCSNKKTVVQCNDQNISELRSVVHARKKLCAKSSKSPRELLLPTKNLSPILFTTSCSSSSSNSSRSSGDLGEEGKSLRQFDEIKAPKARIKRTRSCVLHEKNKDITSSRPSPLLQNGTKVFGKWFDKHYYPGIVESTFSHPGEYRVRFDDGNVRTLHEDCIIIVDDFLPDQQVMFCKKAGGGYIDGVVKETFMNGVEEVHKVKSCNNEVVDCPRRNVMLSAEQAAMFLSLNEHVENCRTTNGEKSLSKVTNFEYTTSPRSTILCEKRETASARPTNQKNREIVRKSQKGSSGKCGHGKKNVGNRRKSPRKINSCGGILSKNKDLFCGYGFVLTGKNVTYSLNDSESREEQQIYTKNDVKAQLKACGGEILDGFQDDISVNSCFLLSNTCQTTAKYFHALVLNVPCISHVWIRDCCVENRLIGFQSYLLPAGKDIINDELIENQSYRGALRGLKVHLVGPSDFQLDWKKVLKAAGCQMVSKLPPNPLQTLQQSQHEPICDVIIVGSSHVMHSTIQKSKLLNIPAVTIHWLKQCIITGKKWDFDAHDTFVFSF